ncbi:TPA: acyltransferase family protein [Escherichia coli]
MLKYRPDIDGLRALAVLLVVLYHAKLPIPGGFIGVDVFFVISGFLITSIIDKEIRNKEFTFSSFYVRRVKRLVPAFFALVIALFLYCSYYLMPDDLISFSKSAMYALLGVSNFYFYANTNYFDSSATEPLLHTWSLSVEEQFYLFWPLILMFVYRSKKPWVKTGAFSLLFISSVIASQYYAATDKNLAYMMLPTRFFELMAGALLAINFRIVFERNTNPNVTSIVGAALIIGSAVLMNDASIFPGLMALPVTIGTVLIISSSNGAPGIVNRWLSFRPVVYVGKVSYSFYLWHWPVLILASYRGIDLTTINAIMLVAASFVASCVSYHFVEQPARKLKSPYAVFPVFYIAPLVISIAYMQYIASTGGIKSRMEGVLDELNEENTAHVIRSKCMGTMKVGNFDECWLGVKKRTPDAIMIGDSFGNAYAGFVDVLAKNAGLMVHDTMRSSTPSIPDVYAAPPNNQWSDRGIKEIVSYNNARTAYAMKERIVIISDFFDQYSDDNKAFRTYNINREDVSDKAYQMRVDYIKSLIKNGNKVVVIARPFDTLDSSSMGRLRMFKMRKADIDGIKFPYGMKKTEREEYRLKRDVPEIVLIDPNDILCKRDECSASIQKSIIFRKDGAHLNWSGSVGMGEKYLSEKGNPLTGL